MYRNEHSPSKNRRIAIQGKKQISKLKLISLKLYKSSDFREEIKCLWIKFKHCALRAETSSFKAAKQVL